MIGKKLQSLGQFFLLHNITWFDFIALFKEVNESFVFA